jgi:hypothetical protein
MNSYPSTPGLCEALQESARPPQGARARDLRARGHTMTARQLGLTPRGPEDRFAFLYDIPIRELNGGQLSILLSRHGWRSAG